MRENYERDFKNLYQDYVKDHKSATFPIYQEDGKILEVFPIMSSQDMSFNWYENSGNQQCWIVLKQVDNSHGDYQRMYLEEWKNKPSNHYDGGSYDKKWEGWKDFGFKRDHFNVEEEEDTADQDGTTLNIIDLIDKNGRVLCS